MPIPSLTATIVLILGACIAAAIDIPVVSYVTRPDILAPNLTFTSFDRTKATPVGADQAQGLEPGYFFLATWKGVAQNAPYIFDNGGNLVWSGYDSSLPEMGFFNFQTHQLSNATSLLSVFRGYADTGVGRGHVALLDQGYHVYKTIEAPSALKSLDFHDFHLSDDGKTAIVTSFQPIQADLAAYDVKDIMGWLMDSVFYVLNLEQGNTIQHQWHSSSQVALNESSTGPTTDFGAGLAYSYGYDYFHLNSISRFQNGDYLLSSRHTNTLYRIAGTTGKIIWRLGGRQSSFTQDRLNFSSQHDARILQETADGTTVISIFNNAHNGIVDTNTSSTSSALVISLDERTMSAYPVEEFLPPTGPGLSRALGSFERLPNGNSLISWGYLNAITEFSPGGHPLLNIVIHDESSAHYRVHKANWTATPPLSEFIVYAYAPNSTLNTHLYISWNGATEVRAWQIHGTVEGGEKDLLLGQVDKTGFETHFEAEQFVATAWVAAIDVDGNVLGKSQVMRTIVPKDQIWARCGKTHCVKQVLMQEKEEEAGKGPVCKGAGDSGVMGYWVYFQMLVFFVLGAMANKMFGTRVRPWRRR